MIPSPVRFRSLVLLSLLGLGACSLVGRREAPMVLSLPLPNATRATDWPQGLEPGRVGAIAALQGNRVIVADGSLRRQYAGVRWVDAPAVLMAEQLQWRRAQRPGPVAIDTARLDLQLTAFHLRLDGESGRTVVVGATGTLVCGNGRPSQVLAPIEASVAPAAGDLTALATAFAQASDAFLTQMLAATVALCAPDPTAAATPSGRQ